MNLKRHVDKIVLVEWRDAVGDSQWKTEQEAKDLELAVIVSVGYLMAVFPDRVVMASDRDGYGNVNGTSAIPRGWIRRIQRLR